MEQHIRVKNTRGADLPEEPDITVKTLEEPDIRVKTHEEPDFRPARGATRGAGF